MRFAALATDYDGTLADHGLVRPETVEMLRRFRRSGRRIILVTGRTLKSLQQVFPDIHEFDCIVAENGATLYDPVARTEEVLTEVPPERLVGTLRQHGAFPLEVGHVIVATAEDQKKIVLDVIQELGLELHIIFNKGSLMILPSGVNKATGLKAAAGRLSLSMHNLAGIGDAENDHAFLAACEFTAAVANGLPTLKERVQLVTQNGCGRGVEELMAEMLETDLCRYAARLGQSIVVGRDERGGEVRLQPSGTTLLVGTSGAGKSTLTTVFLEGLAAAGYQFSVLDAEGDYETLEQALILGDSRHVPAVSDILKALDNPAHNVVANLLALELDQRPNYFKNAFGRLQELRNRVGRPHCIVVDEAHHFLPRTDATVGAHVHEKLGGVTMIAVRPERLPLDVLAQVQTVVVAGQDPAEAIQAFSSALGLEPPALEHIRLERGQMLAWQPGNSSVMTFIPAATAAVRVRHRRKYAEGELAPERSFYFRGPAGRLNLRAFNLMTFLSLMDGVDEETWLFHLKNGEYSIWFRREIKDEDLAREAEAIERQASSPTESRQQMHRLITSRYTL